MHFDGLNDFFDSISNEKYIVLRNYEEYDNDRFLDNHPDIDILCLNVKAIVRKTNAQPKGSKDDGLHYLVSINGKNIPVDMRHVGDGYYDTKIESNVLANRIKHNHYYVMDSKDYFYTLLYHAIIHKGSISEDYKKRLIHLGNEICVQYDDKTCFNLLDMYMRSNGYRYTYPKARSTVAHFENIDRSLIRPSLLHTYRKIRSLLGKRIKIILGRG